LLAAPLFNSSRLIEEYEAVLNLTSLISD
jgi:hypothetical protein